ncbi:MAG: ABC transporter permease [Betaproteobacteria bacterium]|nr:ABC transporter permease [Betaproteobacteria bacterium]
MNAWRQYLPLYWRLTGREWQQRFAGSTLGLLWTLAGPLIQLAIFSFVFGQIFKGRVDGLGTDNYATFVALGLWPWLMFSEGVLRGTTAVSSNGNLVKKAAFPHVVLVAAAVSAAFLAHLAGFAAVLVVLAALGQSFKLSGLPALVLILGLMFLLALGLAMAFAALQVFVRDTEHALAPALTMLQYLTPVLYPLTVLPEAYRGWLEWNPMVGYVTSVRAALIPAAPDIAILPSPAVVAASVVTFIVGLLLLRRLSPYFEDHL